ncbi:hypothetical protein INR75_02790 [Zunongwangia sp. SCSIO 43204]|uniref:hypothetical protein n=1 Tax=Zunongwangia sp. SCSIO 43204 TaxID=2779359 RepID=UPI001CA9544A|nr:hypothetical protein [Zunongwangia sp. SCSIO 43204]UAB84974.1 hypothetical protein INR75_02790 [Zunongwangia sp. SCSIO 43204]
MPEKFEPIDIEFLINSPEVKIEAKKVKDNIKGIADTADAAKKKVNTNGGIAAPLAAAGNAAETAGAKAAAAAPKWNGLGNSINQITRELPAFTYSAQTGFLAISNNLPILADEISRIKRENDALIKSGKQGVPVWKQITKSLFSWNTALSLAVTLITIYGKEIGAFIADLFRGKEAIDQQKKSLEALNKAYESSEFQRAIKELSELRINLDLAKQGMADKKTVVDDYNKSIGKTAAKAKTLDEVEQGLVKNADAYIEMTLKKAAANLALEDAAQKAMEAAKNERKEAEEFANAADKTSSNIAATGGLSGSMYGVGTFNLNEYTKGVKEAGEKRKKVQQDQLEEEKKTLEEIAQEFLEDAAKAAKKMGGYYNGGNEDEDDNGKKLISQRKKLLEKIADLDREYARKQLDRDAEEIQALRDKFTKVRELIQEFNDDPKNKDAKIDISALGVIENNAEKDLRYRQETRSLREELSKQQDIYKEIEDFKTRFGIEKAKERYGEELDQYENFAALIRQKVVNNQSAFDAVEDGTANAAQTERVAFLEAARQEEVRIEREKYIDLLEEYQSYAAKRKLLIEQFQEEYDKLILEGNFEEAENRKKQLQEELDDLDDAQLKRKESYKELFQHIGRLTIQEGKKLIENAKKLLETEQMSAETKARILKLIAETEEKIRNLKYDEIFKAAEAFGMLGQSLTQIGEDVGSPVLSGMGSFLTNVANGANDLADAMEAFDEGDSMGQAQAALQGTMQLIGMLTSAAAQRKQAEEDYYRAIVGYQNAYNQSLNDQIRLQSILDENVFIKDYEGRITDANKALIEANEEFLDALDKLENGQAKAGTRNAVDWGAVGQGAASGAAIGASVGGFIGAGIGAVVGGIAGLFGGKKKKTVWHNLLEEFPDLVDETKEGIDQLNTDLADYLIQNDLLNEETKEMVQNALDWKESVIEAREQIKNVISDLTGSFSGELRSALVDAFENGEDAAVRMGDTVEKVLENIISNLLFNQIFSQAFEDLEKDMADSYDIGGDRNWVDDFSRFFTEAEGLSNQFNQAMSDAQEQAKAFGFDIFNPDDDPEDPRGLQGAIRREMTEETASELTGLFRAQFDITKRHFQLHERHFELEQRNYNATISIMQTSALIEQNTAATVVQLALAVSELKKIQDNTKSTTARDIGR